MKPIPAHDLSWHDQAACDGADPTPFFGYSDEAIARAKGICATCPVEAECLEYALATRQEHGVWGGRSEGERQTIRRRQRRLQAVQP